MIAGAETIQRGVGYVLTTMVAACLVVAWLVTAPLLKWGVVLSDHYRKRLHSKMR